MSFRFNLPNHAIEQLRVRSRAASTLSDLDLRVKLDDFVGEAMDAGRCYETTSDEGPCIHVPLDDSFGPAPLTAVVVDDKVYPGRKAVVTVLTKAQAERRPRAPRAPSPPAPDDWLVGYQKAGRDHYVPVPPAAVREKIVELVEVEHVPHVTIRVWKPVSAKPRVVFDVEGVDP